MVGFAFIAQRKSNWFLPSLSGVRIPLGAPYRERSALIIYYPVISEEINVPYAHLTLITSEETNYQVCHGLFAELMLKLSLQDLSPRVEIESHELFGDNHDMLVAKIKSTKSISESYEIAKQLLTEKNQILDTRYSEYTPHITVDKVIDGKTIQLGKLTMSHKILGT